MYSRIKDSSFSLIIFIFIIILALILTSFYIKQKNKIIDVGLSNSNNSISIKNKVTMDDASGKAINFEKSKDKFQGYLEFKVISKSTVKTKYEIYAISKNKQNIHPNYIKVYLTDENDKPISGFEDFAVPTFYNLRVSSINPNGRRIYHDSINPNETKTFKLRVWFSDAYTLEKEEKDFDIKLFVGADY